MARVWLRSIGCAAALWAGACTLNPQPDEPLDSEGFSGAANDASGGTQSDAGTPAGGSLGTGGRFQGSGGTVVIGSGGSGVGGSGTGGTDAGTGGAAPGTGGTPGTGGSTMGSGGAIGVGGSGTGGSGVGGAAMGSGGAVGTGGSGVGGDTMGFGGFVGYGGSGWSGSAGAAMAGSAGAWPTGDGGTGTGGAPDVGPEPCECETPAGEYGPQIDSTIVVNSGEVYDGGCLIYRANPGTLGPGDQSEGQSPVFRVNNGGTLRNVVLGASAADGIHLYGDVTLENIHWLDIGEDAMTVKESGTVHLNCGSSTEGEDKTFQVNAASEIHISNFTARNAGKFMRQNGDTTFHVDVYIDHCDISGMDECIFRTDSTTSHVTMTNTRYHNIGDALFIFGSNLVNGDSGQSSVSNCEQY